MYSHRIYRIEEEKKPKCWSITTMGGREVWDLSGSVDIGGQASPEEAVVC